MTQADKRKSRRGWWGFAIAFVGVVALAGWYGWSRHEANEQPATDAVREAEQRIVGRWIAHDNRGGEYRLEFRADKIGSSRESRIVHKRLPHRGNNDAMPESGEFEIRAPVAHFRYRLIPEQTLALHLGVWDWHLVLNTDPVTLFELAHPIVTVSDDELVFHDPSDTTKTRVYHRQSDTDSP